jgi:HPt (histidine-containing phosphotransfer) domain-containing protein
MEFKIELTNLYNIANGDEEFIRTMIQAYIDELPIYKAELEKALAKRKHSEIAGCVHKLRGPVKMLGVNAGYKAFEEMDRINFEPDFNLPHAIVSDYCNQVLAITDEILNQLQSLVD